MGREQMLSAPKQIWMICQMLIQASVVPAMLPFPPVIPTDPRSVETLQWIVNDNRRFLLAAGARLNRFTGHYELGATGPYVLLVSDFPWIRTGCKLTVSSVSQIIVGWVTRGDELSLNKALSPKYLSGGPAVIICVWLNDSKADCCCCHGTSAHKKMFHFAKQQRGGTVLLHLLLFHVSWTNLAIYIMFFWGIYWIFKRGGACLAIPIIYSPSHNLLPTERAISLGSELQQGLTGPRFSIQSVCLDKL